ATAFERGGSMARTTTLGGSLRAAIRRVAARAALLAAGLPSTAMTIRMVAFPAVDDLMLGAYRGQGVDLDQWEGAPRARAVRQTPRPSPCRHCCARNPRRGRQARRS